MKSLMEMKTATFWLPGFEFAISTRTLGLPDLSQLANVAGRTRRSRPIGIVLVYAFGHADAMGATDAACSIGDGLVGPAGYSIANSISASIT